MWQQMSIQIANTIFFKNPSGPSRDVPREQKDRHEKAKSRSSKTVLQMRLEQNSETGLLPVLW
jgi:hypothetical protein